jgi:hypothetical protein
MVVLDCVHSSALFVSVHIRKLPDWMAEQRQTFPYPLDQVFARLKLPRPTVKAFFILGSRLWGTCMKTMNKFSYRFSTEGF